MPTCTWADPANWEGGKPPTEGDTVIIQPLHMIGGSLDTRPKPPPPPPNEIVRGWDFPWLAPLWRDFCDWCFKPVAAACMLGGAIWLVGCL